MEGTAWLRSKSLKLIREGAYEEAIPYLERILTLPGAETSDIYFAFFSLGEAHLLKGSYRKAQGYFKKSIEMSGEDAEGLFLLGQAYMGDGRLKLALPCLEKASKLKPQDEFFILSLGSCLCYMGEFARGEDIIRKAIAVNPEFVEGHTGLARCMAARGDFEGAHSALRAAKEKFPLSLDLRRATKEIEHHEETLKEYEKLRGSQRVDKGGKKILKRTEQDPVLVLAKTSMVEEGFSPFQIKSAEQLWKDFRRTQNPRTQKPEVWAAAIEYTIIRLDFSNLLWKKTRITQRYLAEKYSVSLWTVSRNFTRIATTLKLSQFDQRYATNPLKEFALNFSRRSRGEE